MLLSDRGQSSFLVMDYCHHYALRDFDPMSLEKLKHEQFHEYMYQQHLKEIVHY